MMAFLIAIGVVLSFFHIPVLTSKAYPIQHMVNALAGVILGPVDAVIIALIIGIIRVSYNLGTVYAFPGGLPGGFIVGTINILLMRYFDRRRAALLSVWSEPIGTVLIGATISLFIVAPWIGDEKMMAVAGGNVFLGLLSLYGIWGISSISGVIIAFIILTFLDRSGFLDKLGGYD
jgi:energy coupling factor transporter S component ThiW